MRKIGEGAEARLFETSLFGRRAVVKVRQEKGYRAKELDFALRTSRTRREARLLHKAREAGVGAPRVIALGKFSIYMERIEGKLLKDCAVRASEYGKIGVLLARMHNRGIIHGDFTPANLMVVGKEFCVIDFGLAVENGSDEEKAIDLLLMKRSVQESRYRNLERAYAREAEGSREVLRRLSEVEKRGRYQIRTLT
jgi:Kae1-associated kinase Bud32